MPSFSERVGAVSPRTTLQISGMDAPLRNSIWNFLHSCYQSRYECWRGACWTFASLFFKVPVDEVPHYDQPAMLWLKKLYFALSWNDAYEFVICLCDNFSTMRNELGSEVSRKDVHKIFNKIFETEHSGYRFVSGELVPIAHPVEIEAIEQAVETGHRPGFAGAQEHLTAALRLMASRPEADYRNSIKESISAVESIVKQLGGQHNDFGPSLDALIAKHPMHGALRDAFMKLFGYTSNEKGIRHAMLDGPANVGFDEAKFMVVACSAFVNFVAAKVAKTA